MLQLKIIMRILKIIMKKNRCKIEQIQKALNLKQYTSHFGHHVMHMYKRTLGKLWNWIFRLAHRSMDCAIWINKWYASTYSNSLRHIYLLNWYKLIFICWHTHLSIICFFFDCISVNDCSLNVNIRLYILHNCLLSWCWLFLLLNYQSNRDGSLKWRWTDAIDIDRFDIQQSILLF